MQESQLLIKGYRLFTDNFYTKPKTAEFLFANKTALVGTVRVNSVGMPKNVAKQKLQVGEAKFWRKYPSDMLAVTFREKKSQTKPVLAHSTCHDAGMETKTIKGKQKTKPVLIFYYNKYMGGVDLSDKKIYHYAAERSTRRYWKKIFHNLIDIAILDSWILFSLSTGKKLDRERFIIEVVENLCEGDDIANSLPQHLSFRLSRLSNIVSFASTARKRKIAMFAVTGCKTREAVLAKRDLVDRHLPYPISHRSSQSISMNSKRMLFQDTITKHFCTILLEPSSLSLQSHDFEGGKWSRWII
ncbi:PiggyBac transposase uribo2 [Plakobranchus ocellatus]|uniref:PiggyBac transposase uribo2 n=1 Tax=Plakobranchus ocellatus TaxID=259542 RepID=A0AAV3YSW0_9GAST|nr:PiggyBac transposase uribo2 [Plakobranchus ocellatus]